MANAESDITGIPDSIREKFKIYERSISVVNSRRAALLGAIFMVAGASLDFIVYPQEFVLFLCIRIGCGILLSLIYLDLRTARTGRQGDIIVALITLLPILSICFMIYITGGGESVYYAGLNLVLLGLSLLLRWNFQRSLAMTLTCAACYAASVYLPFESPDRSILYNNSYFLFVTSVFVVAGSYFHEKLRLSEFALRTEVEQSRETLRTQYQRLGELDEAKTRFFANISHELRTPLTIMLGITEKLSSTHAEEPKPALVREMLDLLEHNGLRLMKLIDDLLDLVRFDTGHADLDFQPTRIKDHFEGLMKSLRHLAEKDGVALLWTCTSSDPRIQMDRDKFDKIILNLVINSIKFTPSGGNIDVDIEVSGNRLSLSVKDTGVGIPQENLGLIFERFWQVDNSSTRKFQGTGIGLALVRSVTESLGGEIAVTSQLGVGTEFRIGFPVSVADLEEEPEESVPTGRGIIEIHRKAAMALPTRTGARPAARHDPQPLPSMTKIGGRDSDAMPLVLIADDEPDIRRFLIMQLDNVEIIEAADGAEALELAKLHRPQIALLDHMMPELDGVEVCRRIKENHSTRDTSVIILTARANEQTKIDALRAGASDFLTKPFSSAELGLRLSNQILMGRFRREMSDVNRDLRAALETIKENEVLMLRNEKLSALGRMSAGIIHEINNPLNYANAGLHALNTFTQLLPEDERHEFDDILKDIREGISRVSQIVIDLRQFTRDVNSESPKDALKLDEVAGTAIRMMSHELGKEIAIVPSTGDHLPAIFGNSNQLIQVLINLLQNGIDAIRERMRKSPGLEGLITVSMSSDGGGALLSIRDNGIGIPPEDVGKIFDPFFTSKEIGAGMGLGLSITHQILRDHQVRIDVDSRPEEYTEIRLLFPDPDTFSDMAAADQRNQQYHTDDIL